MPSENEPVKGAQRPRREDRRSESSSTPPLLGSSAARDNPGPRGRWKSVWFQCCHTYGRIYRNAERTRYEGRCPRCGAHVYTLIGPHGTNQRIFRAI